MKGWQIGLLVGGGCVVGGVATAVGIWAYVVKTWRPW